MLQRLKHYGHFLKGLFSTNVYLLRGMWKLTKLPQPAVTIFGGSRIEASSSYAKKAFELSKILAGQGFSIITGGGPGIMEAANYGAIEYLKECQLDSGKAVCKPLVSVGIGLIRLNTESENPYIQENITMRHFFARKWLLVRYSIGFAVFPGGFGTLDEFFEILTLRQTEHMQKAPIVLIDSHYWGPIIEWMTDRALKNGLIDQEDMDLITVLDDVGQAAKAICDACKINA